MALSLDDQEALQHEKTMLKIRTRNLRELEKQEATYGFDARPYLRAEIEDVTEKIARHKSEIDRLETLNVEGETPLKEVEYRVILAEAWDTPTGRPTVVGNERKEFARLRLHITEARSETIERDIRARLLRARVMNGQCEEAFRSDAFYAFAKRITDPDKYVRRKDLEVEAINPFRMLINLHPGKAFSFIMGRAKVSLHSMYRPFKLPYRDRWIRLIIWYVHAGDHFKVWEMLHHEYFPDIPFNLDDWPPECEIKSWPSPSGKSLSVTNLVIPDTAPYYE